MIEVLVSVFVLALGVIGVAGMQMNAMRTSHHSKFQTVAVQLASEMADKMRANAEVMNQVGGENAFLFSYDASEGAEGDGVANCYGASNCDASAMAAFDIQEWQLRLNASLPGARATICRDQAPVDDDNMLTWGCDDAAGGVNAPMVIKIGWQGRGVNPDGSANTEGNYPPSVAITVESYVNPTQ